MTGEALVVAAKKMMTALLMIRDLNALIGRLALPMLCYVNLVKGCITVLFFYYFYKICLYHHHHYTHHHWQNSPF
jgi:hypothetical protein